jgi:hypothetical protein
MSNHKRSNLDQNDVKIQTLTLDDGRRAERHVSVDENGQEVVEIFAEEKRPLKLEKRILREYKNVIAKETHQTVKDGEVAYEEVHSTEPEVPLQLRSRVGMVDHHKLVDGDYVRKEEIGTLIADGVVAGVTALMENYEPVVNPTSVSNQKTSSTFSAQSLVEKSVEEKKQSDGITVAIMVAIVIAQAAFFAYLFLF